MLRYGLLLVLLPILAAAQSCNIGAGSSKPCFQHMLVVVDNTAYVRTASRATGIFNYIQTLLSAYDLSAQSAFVSMGYYGMSDPSLAYSPIVLYFGQTDPAVLCDNYNQLQRYEMGDNLGNTKITDALVSLYNVTASPELGGPYDSIVWFTASTDQTDIITASHYLELFTSTFTVINMASADFSSWTGAKVIYQDYPFPAGFEQTIIGQQCGASGSTIAPTMLPTFAPKNNCPCNIAKSWNDIFLSFDGSNALAANQFNELVNYFFASAASLTVGQAQQYQSRVGIITYESSVPAMLRGNSPTTSSAGVVRKENLGSAYATNYLMGKKSGDQAKLIGGLDKYGSLNDLFNDVGNVVRTNTEGTNILGAIDIARDAYEGPTHRAASRKVIIIGASTYREGAYDSPITQANTFKDNGGVIIVVAYGDLHGNIADELQQIASPGYYIDTTSQTPTVGQLTALLCSANCFCPSTYSPDSSSTRGEPTDGCFQTSDLQSVEYLAKNYCIQQHKGCLAAVPTTAQQIFISRNAATNTPIYVGLQRSSNGQWTWSDGTYFSGSINDNGGDCATLTRISGFKTQFDSVPCTSAQLYACQATPCSTEIFCSA